jgi:hypothetical protein
MEKAIELYKDKMLKIRGNVWNLLGSETLECY